MFEVIIAISAIYLTLENILIKISLSLYKLEKISSLSHAILNGKVIVLIFTLLISMNNERRRKLEIT